MALGRSWGARAASDWLPLVALVACSSTEQANGSNVVQAVGGQSGSSSTEPVLEPEAARGGASGAAQASAGGATRAGAGGATQAGAGGADPEQCPWGDQLEHDTPFGHGTSLRICALSGPTDTLRFALTTPDQPAAGGYIIVSVRNVKHTIRADAEITPAGDSRKLDIPSQGNGLGDDLDTWFAAQARSQFFIDVANVFASPSIQPGDVTLSATFVPVPDSFEPNDTRAEAKPIALGTPIQAYAFNGYGQLGGVQPNAWYDRFKITLAAGTPTITLNGAPTDFPLSVSLDDPKMLSFTATGSTLATGAVTVTPARPIAAGDYFIVVNPSDNDVDAFGPGSSPPDYATMPYSLTVTE